VWGESNKWKGWGLMVGYVMGAFVRPKGGIGTTIPVVDFWVGIG